MEKAQKRTNEVRLRAIGVTLFLCTSLLGACSFSHPVYSCTSEAKPDLVLIEEFLENSDFPGETKLEEFGDCESFHGNGVRLSSTAGKDEVEGRLFEVATCSDFVEKSEAVAAYSECDLEGLLVSVWSSEFPRENGDLWELEFEPLGSRK